MFGIILPERNWRQDIHEVVRFVNGYALSAVTALVAFIAVTALWMGLALHYGYALSGDVDSYKYRASGSVSAASMVEYIDTYQQEVKSHGLSSGSSALLVKSASSDLALTYQEIQTISAQAHRVVTLNPTTSDYATNMMSLRASIDKLPDYAKYMPWAAYKWLIWADVLLLVWCFIAVVREL